MADTNGSTRADTSEISPSTGPFDQQPELEALRRELDAIDTGLLEAVRARIDVCVRIAEVKRRRNIPMMQPQRVGLVQERAEQFASENGLSPEFLHRLYDVMIAETCRVEDVVIGAGDGSPRALG